jgi:hypothetical protein
MAVDDKRVKYAILLWDSRPSLYHGIGHTTGLIAPQCSYIRFCRTNLYEMFDYSMATARLATGWTTGGGSRSSSPGTVNNFLQIVQTGSGVHATSYPMGTVGSFPGGKADGV